MNKRLLASLIATLLSSSVEAVERERAAHDILLACSDAWLQRAPGRCHQARMTHTIPAMVSRCRKLLVLSVLVLINYKRLRMKSRWSASSAEPIPMIDGKKGRKTLLSVWQLFSGGCSEDASTAGGGRQGRAPRQPQTHRGPPRGRRGSSWAAPAGGEGAGAWKLTSAKITRRSLIDSVARLRCTRLWTF